jgi:hypothetical protein
MTALAIVKHLDVLEDCGLGLGPRSEAALVNHLLLQRRKEAFHRRIIQALALAAHGLREPSLLDQFPIFRSGVSGGFKRSSQCS